MKDIPGFEGRYAITQDGRVWSHKRVGKGGYKTGRWLAPAITRDGYYRVTLCRNSVLKGYLVHRLVALTYMPNPKRLPNVNHLDNNPQNNSIFNLEWCTQKQNVAHAVKQGRHIRGERMGRSKLTRSQATEIKHSPEISALRMAAKFNISKYQVWAIRGGRSWSYL